jgi:hypothetical protein
VSSQVWGKTKDSNTEDDKVRALASNGNPLQRAPAGGFTKSYNGVKQRFDTCVKKSRMK